MARTLSRLPVPVTVDIEGGFSDRVADVAELVTELASFGIAGINLEDGRSDGTLAPVDHQVTVIGAVKRAAPQVFLNARTDTFWLGDPDRDETLRRARAFAEAGADGVFVPGIVDDADIRAVLEAADVPLNVLYLPGKTEFSRLERLGVHRVSTGSLLFRKGCRPPSRRPSTSPGRTATVRHCRTGTSSGWSVTGDPVGEPRQGGRARRRRGRLARVGGAVKRVHRVDAEPAQRFGLPAADAAVHPRQGGQRGVLTQDEVAQSSAREVGGRDAVPRVAARVAETGLVVKDDGRAPVAGHPSTPDQAWSTRPSSATAGNIVVSIVQRASIVPGSVRPPSSMRDPYRYGRPRPPKAIRSSAVRCAYM